MKKKSLLILFLIAFVFSLLITVLCFVSLIFEIQKQSELLFDIQWLMSVPYKTKFSNCLIINIISFVFSLLLCIIQAVIISFLIRADISELTKSSVQAYRAKKADRAEAKRQKKIEKAKKTLAELEDKEKDGE